MTITYNSNNSGGSWWLSDEQWKALEAAGWVVRWVRDNTSSHFLPAGETRWLGALATSATREGLTLEEAVEEWTRVTGEDPDATGCECCGMPHFFSEN